MNASSYEIPAVHERPCPLPVEAGRYLQISPKTSGLTNAKTQNTPEISVELVAVMQAPPTSYLEAGFHEVHHALTRRPC